MAKSAERAGGGERVNIALFDSSTLIGKAVKSHLTRRRFPVGKVRLFDTGAVEEGGNLGEFGGEPLLAVRPDLAEMERVDLAFWCGREGSGKDFLDWPRRGDFVAIDLTRSANALPSAPVVNASVNPAAVKRHEGILASPHPVSQFLSTVLAPLARSVPLAEVVSLVLQPVSEDGEQGIEELYRQTVGLLNFSEVPQELFGRVLAFNVVPASFVPGKGPRDDELSREVATILSDRSFAHALKVLHVPVFHCHAFVSRLRFHQEHSVDAIRKALAEEPTIRIREGATPAEIAGEEHIVLGEIRPDPSAPGCFWLWGITDNLATGATLNAVRIAEELVGSGSLKRRKS